MAVEVTVSIPVTKTSYDQRDGGDYDATVKVELMPDGRIKLGGTRFEWRDLADAVAFLQNRNRPPSATRPPMFNAGTERD